MKLRLASVAVIASLASLTAACGDSSTTSSESSSTPSGAQAQGEDTGGDAERAITEADIVQMDEQSGRLYAMSKSGTLAIVDVSTPGKLVMLGKSRIVGEPFEMYRRGNTLLAMTNGGLRADGSLEPLNGDESVAPVRNLSVGAIVAALDVSDPTRVKTIESYKISGQIADSRLVGNVLYLATYETGTCWQCVQGPRTLVTSFDVSTENRLRPVDQIAFASSESTAGALYAPWKRSIIATTERIYIGGFAEGSSGSPTTAEGHIEVLDIHDPSGLMMRAGSFDTAGPITSRWQLDEHNGFVRVISQRGIGVSQNGTGSPEIETFRIGQDEFSPYGSTTMTLPVQEGLKTVRFDGDRAYAITFRESDPLFAIDLSDPAHPQQKGELQMPGWVFHLEPRGDRLVGLGLNRRDSTGNLNVSLFDVSDLWAPRLVQRVSFGPTMWSDAQITGAVLAEDQNRIQKAFTVSDDGLVTVPFSGASACSGGASDSGVQLIEMRNDTLAKRALLPIAGNPRRAIRREGELLAVSDSHVRSFSLSRIDRAQQTAEVKIGVCMQRAAGLGGGRMFDDDHYGHCSMSGAPSSGFGWPGAIALAMGAAAFIRRRRS